MAATMNLATASAMAWVPVGSIVDHGMGFHHSIVGVGHFGGGGFGHGMAGGFGHGGGGGHR